MKIGVSMPVVLQVDYLYAMTMECLRSLRTQRGDLEVMLTLTCNRLAYPAAKLRDEAWRACGLRPAEVNVVNEGDLGVAGGWNRGIRAALAWGADTCLIVANDTVAEPSCVDALLRFGEADEEHRCGVWSATATNDGVQRDPGGSGEGCDFSLCCLRRDTVERVGYFDEGFRPAYFEDNDFAARVVLGGQSHRYCYAARFFHRVSQTLHHDAEMAHHIRHWFVLNRARFVSKWGREPVGDEAGIRSGYFATPFDSGRELSWCG